MAIARKILPAPSIHLELTHDEAQAVYDVLNHVGGDPKLSRRQHVESVRAAMEATGFRSGLERGARDIEATTTGIYFTDIS